MSGNKSSKNQLKLLLCSSDRTHIKTSQIKIFKELLFMNFNTTFFDLFDYFESFGRTQTENYIKNIIKDFQIILIQTDKPFYNFNFFKELKKINNEIIIVYTDGDAIQNFPSYSVNFINEIDIYAVTDSLKVVNYLNKNNTKSFFWYTQYKQDFFKLEDRLKINDVIFYGGSKNRKDYLNYIEENNIRLNVYGRGFQPDFTPIKTLNKFINKSKIGLSLNFVQQDRKWKNNYFNDFNNCKHVKGKNIEIPLCGTFLLAEYLEDLEELYINKKEAVYFENKKEMIELIQYYLKNSEEREQIAMAGYNKALNNYEGSVMTEKLVKEIKDFYLKREENLKNKNQIKYKQEVDWYVTWSLNHAFNFFNNKNYKAFLDMIKVIKYGVPISYVSYKLKQLIINKVSHFKNFLFLKKK